MTVLGMYARDTPGMDLLALARTVQADKIRQIDEEARRRRLLARDDATETDTTLPNDRSASAGTDARARGAAQRPGIPSATPR
jgi:hypothetical protein